MQSILAKATSKIDIDLYREDGFIAIQNKTAQQTDKIRKKIVEISKETNF